MNKNLPSFLTVAVVLYTAWNSTTLIQGWKTAPYESLMWLMLIVWCLPILYFWGFNRMGHHENILLLSLALAFSFIGSIGSLNASAYFGFALALTALVPWSWPLIIWVLCSLAWMPVFGWFGSYFLGEYTTLTRSLIIIFGSLSAIYQLAKGKK